jgi:hypothetical protein
LVDESARALVARSTFDYLAVYASLANGTPVSNSYPESARILAAFTFVYGDSQVHVFDARASEWWYWAS